MLITDPVHLAPWFDCQKGFWQISLANNPQNFLQSDPTRIGIIFSPNQSNASNIVLQPGLLQTPICGIEIQPTGPPVIITMQDLGGLSQQSWYVETAILPGLVQWIECLYRPQ